MVVMSEEFALRSNVELTFIVRLTLVAYPDTLSVICSTSNHITHDLQYAVEHLRIIMHEIKKWQKLIYP